MVAGIRVPWLALVAIATGGVVAGAVACGPGERPGPTAGSGKLRPGSSADDAPAGNAVEVGVHVTRRFGHLVRLQITGVGKKRRAGDAFENPKRWVITAMADDKMFTRAVNGTARVVRDPVGRRDSDLWDVEVSFWVAFNVPEEVMAMVVRIAPPGSAAVETEVDLDWSMDELDPPGE